jgi:hypothetical protein
MAKQVCGLYQSQWGSVTTPQIFGNAMSLVQANISGSSIITNPPAESSTQ